MEIKDQSAELRKDTTFFLTKRLYDKGFARKEIDNLYKFIDWLIGLPQELEIDYLEKVHKLEETYKMPYITSAEHFEIEKGREDGSRKTIARRSSRLCLYSEKITKLPLPVIHSLRVQEGSI
jgi:hypothetical protein